MALTKITSNQVKYGDRNLTDKLDEIASVKDFGAVGDGITDDTQAFTEAFSYALNSTYPVKLHVPGGLYKITAPLPTITKPFMLEGDGARSSILSISGNVNAVKISGTSIRAANVVISDLGIAAGNQTADYAVIVDFAQHILFRNVLIADPYNSVYIRQAGSVTFKDCLFDKIRGEYGVYAYGESVARNGETDQIDILTFNNCVFQSVYVPGSVTSITDLLTLDGRVHTVQINGLRLLSAKRGIVTKNTPAVASNFYPRFITGDALEVESMLSDCCYFDYCVDFWIDNFFAAGSTSGRGIYLGANVSNWNIDKGSVNSNWLGGIDIQGAKDVTITSTLVYNNALAGAAARSGIAISANSGAIDIRGGLCGKASWLPAYTENQRYGIDLNAAYAGVLTVHAVDLRGNYTGALYSSGTSAAVGSNVSACPGYNPVGVSLQAVGASPFSYTAGLVRENINLYGGTGVVSTVGGVAVANISPCSFTLQPRQTVSISYATVPTMAVSKQ